MKINLSSLGNLKEDKVLATVGTRKITLKEFLYGYEFGPSFPKKVHNSKEVYLNYLINEKLLADYGFENHLDTSLLYKNNLSAIEADLATEELYKDKILPKVEIKKEDITDAYNKKITEVKLNWLYAPTSDSLLIFARLFKEGLSFDSLFKIQLKDSVFEDQRSMTTDLFKLEQKNPEILKIINSLKVDSISSPVKGKDGWYIFKLKDKSKDLSLGNIPANEFSEIESAIKKSKMDTLSALFVDSLLSSEKPVIKGEAFLLLRAYLGNYILDKDKFDRWKLKEKGDSAIANLKLNESKLGEVVIVKYSSGKYSINDFINWFRLRGDYIKIDQQSYKSYSASIESLIWRMIRDNLLTKAALDNGYQNKNEVKSQLEWWKDKCLFSIQKDEILNSILLKEKKETLDDKLKMEVNRKILSRINILKRSMKVNIDHELLKQIDVDNEDNPNAVETYAAKTGGILPRPAYPSIDFLWESWQ